MKTSPLFCRLLVLFYWFTCIDLLATHSSHQVADTTTNYVVIGAFAKHRNAIKFANHASNDLHLLAKYELNLNRNLYYVYSLTTPSHEEAITEALRLRKETELQDAWVYMGELGVNKTITSVDVSPVTEQPIPVKPLDEPVVEEIVGGASNLDSLKASATDEGIVEEAIPEYVDDGSPGRRFFFKLTRLSDHTAVSGSVEVIDPDKLKKIGDFAANQVVKISDVNNKSGKITAVAEVFGYRKQQVEIDYANPVNNDLGVVLDNGGNAIVPFELVRLKEGDFAIMYNVFFFRDGAIMRPESRYEVNNLLEMMQENSTCRIRIHGHTNGNHHGKIIYRGKDAVDFFSLTGSINSYGSAKELSLARADEIRDFLISEGIEPDRIEVKAWGGKKAIHDKHSPRAQENVRVEVEIIKE